MHTTIIVNIHGCLLDIMWLVLHLSPLYCILQQSSPQTMYLHPVRERRFKASQVDLENLGLVLAILETTEEMSLMNFRK